MSLPPFLARIHNAAGPLLGGIAESELGDRLEASALHLEIDDEQASDPGHRAGYLLAANLGARLYPRLHLDAPDDLAKEAQALARAINKGLDIGSAEEGELVLSWRGGEARGDRVTVAAEGWDLAVDGEAAAVGTAAPPAAMAAAALGCGELFRSLFADLLEHGRSGPEPFELNLVSLGESVETPPLPERVEIDEVHLAGCGAIGQAAVATLRELPVAGTLHAVDHDPLDKGNLQRYLLSGSADVGASKPSLVKRALAGSGLKVEQVPTAWGADERTGPGRETVLAALDTKQGRIELQSGLPRELFNAWTQPQDLGVSRHQAFGTEPCLACLGWPGRARPSESARIAVELGESELRVLAYLGSETPVGQTLQAPSITPTRRLTLTPPDQQAWTERSLLADLIDRFDLPREQFEPLAGLGIRALHRDTVCAGMLIEHGGERDPEISVPLAHQSALAGILLATSLVVDRIPALRELRPDSNVARYDVTRGGAQIWPRPRGIEERCICQDPDFLAAYAARWVQE